MSVERLGVKNLRRNVAYSALAGHIASWSIFGLIFAVDLVMRLEAGTFYKVIGLAVGADMSTAAYAGYVLHMLTGTVIGVLFGYVTSIVRSFNPTSLPKTFGLAIITGIVSWAVLFLPITVFAVGPALPQISVILEQPMLTQLSVEILVGAVGMHVIYGGILGFMYYLAVVPTPRDYEE
jgi:hypothetical protein